MPQKRLMHLIQRFKVIRRRFCAQLFPAAKTITHRRGIQSVAARADEVVFAIADHQGVRRVQVFFGHQVGNQLDLVGPRAIQFAAVNDFEVFGEVEVPGDFPGEDPRLGGRDVQLAPFPVRLGW